jgi:serine/threonine protein kinase
MNDHPAKIGMRFSATSSLRDAIDQWHHRKTPTFLDDIGIAIVVCGVVLGMQFIHSQCVIHRNLQPSNIFIDEHGFAQIGDFESS